MQCNSVRGTHLLSVSFTNATLHRAMKHYRNSLSTSPRSFRFVSPISLIGRDPLSSYLCSRVSRWSSSRRVAGNMEKSIDNLKYRVRDRGRIDVGQYRMCCNNHTAVSCRCLDVVQENAIISALAGLFCRGYATRYSRPWARSTQ